MASYDSYLHDVVSESAYSLIRKLKGKGIPKTLLDILKESLPYEKLLTVLQNEKASILVSTAIRKRNAGRTFMKPEKAEIALQMLDLDLWRIASREFGRRKDGLRTRFQGYADRRDKIAHEGDMGKATRSKGKLKKIRRPFVESALSDIRRLVNAVDTAVLEKVS